MDQEGAETATRDPATTTLQVPLVKMGPLDDPEAFLEGMRRAEPPVGGPVISTAVQGSPKCSAAVTSGEPPGVLEKSHPAMGQPDNEQLTIGKHGRLFAFDQQLRNACRRWLLAEQRDAGQIQKVLPQIDPIQPNY